MLSACCVLGKGISLAELSQAAALGRACLQSGEQREEQIQPGSLPGTRDAALGKAYRGQRDARPWSRQLFAQICWIWRQVLLGSGTSDLVPVLLELVTAPEKGSLRLPKCSGFVQVRSYCTLLSLWNKETLISFPLVTESSFCCSTAGLTERGEQFLPRLGVCQQSSLEGR